MSEQTQQPSTVTVTGGSPAPATQPALATQPPPHPGFFERGLDHLLPGHNTAGIPAAPAVSAEVAAALKDHASLVFGLVQAILQLEAERGGVAGLRDLAVQALPVAESIAKVAGAALAVA